MASPFPTISSEAPPPSRSVPRIPTLHPPHHHSTTRSPGFPDAIPRAPCHPISPGFIDFRHTPVLFPDFPTLILIHLSCKLELVPVPNSRSLPIRPPMVARELAAPRVARRIVSEGWKDGKCGALSSSGLRAQTKLCHNELHATRALSTARTLRAETTTQRPRTRTALFFPGKPEHDAMRTTPNLALGHYTSSTVAALAGSPR